MERYMRYKQTIRMYFFLCWLALSSGLWGVALASPFSEAKQALDAGDHRTAYRGFKRLAMQDHPGAQYQLGMLLLAGKGVAQDTTQGIEWLKRAAGNGSYLAANELAQIYTSGREVAPDEQEAMKWIERATQLGKQQPEVTDEGCE
jgi:hypothetical protein